MTEKEDRRHSPSKLRELYAEVEREVGEEALVLVRVIMQGFAQGLVQEDPHSVDNNAANARVVNFLIERSFIYDLEMNMIAEPEVDVDEPDRDTVRFIADSNNQKDFGFVYFNEQTGKDVILRVENLSYYVGYPEAEADPLMSKVVKIAHEFHKGLANDWESLQDKDLTAEFAHREQISNIFRLICWDMYKNLTGYVEEFEHH